MMLFAQILAGYSVGQIAIALVIIAAVVACAVACAVVAFRQFGVQIPAFVV